MYDLASMGTALIDLTPMGISESGRPLYEANPGGSAANFIVAAARMGVCGAFLGMVGDDPFGRSLESCMLKEHIETRGMRFSPLHPTAVSLVQLSQGGERRFSFYREGSADGRYTPGDVAYDVIEKCGTLHLTSFMLAGAASREAGFAALGFAKEKNKLISFDVNWRPNIWPSEAAGLTVINRIIDGADILKVSQEELELLTGCGVSRWKEGGRMLLARGVRLVVLTLGYGGSAYVCAAGAGKAAASDDVAVDTTGAGDCCFGAFMSEFIRQKMDINALKETQLQAALHFANTAAGYSVTRYGGIDSLPYRKDISCPANK